MIKDVHRRGVLVCIDVEDVATAIISNGEVLGWPPHAPERRGSDAGVLVFQNFRVINELRSSHDKRKLNGIRQECMAIVARQREREQRLQFA